MIDRDEVDKLWRMAQAQANKAELQTFRYIFTRMIESRVIENVVNRLHRESIVCSDQHASGMTRAAAIVDEMRTDPRASAIRALNDGASGKQEGKV